MHYTSGTTGRPKGVRRALTGMDPDEAMALASVLLQFFGVTEGQPNAHLLTSPNYHTAVTVFGGGALHMGHTLVCMDAWDSETALALTERHKCTNSHMVPTQFKRMLSLPDDVRARYDLSSMRWLIHAAAPCPIGIKQQMLDWWGDCVWEYYAATEGGGTIASPQAWRAHPGTVGNAWPISELLIADENGEPQPTGTSRHHLHEDGRRARSSTTGTRRRPRRTGCATTSPSATSATWTRTASCSCATASPT